MKVPRNVSGSELVRSLQKIGYSVSRQKGSHIRLSCNLPSGSHHITIPNHDPIKVATSYIHSHRYFGCPPLF